MHSNSSISQKFDLRLLASIAVTGAIVVAFLMLERASAVFLEIQCPDAPVFQGTQVQCEVELTIREGERIPIQDLEIVVDGPTPLQALFELSGNIISRDAAITDIGLLSSINPGFGFGYGYGYGARLGVDEFTGYGYDFGVGYGYGYGYGFQFVNELFRYRLVIDTTSLAPGDYSSLFVVNTGSPTNPTFRSQIASFTVIGPARGGDVNLDGRVDGEDMRFVAGFLGVAVPLGHPADLNEDGVVDTRDLAILGANMDPVPSIDFFGPRAQNAPFNVPQLQLPLVDGVKTLGVKAHDRNGPVEPFLGSIAYLHTSSPQPGVAPYTMTSIRHSGFGSLLALGPDHLSFDFQGTNMLAGNVIHREGDAPMSLDDPLFDILDNVVYFIEAESGRGMEKRTYVNGTWSLIDNEGTPDDMSDDSVVATGTIEYNTLFLDYTNFQNMGRGQVRVDQGSAFYQDLITNYGTPLLDMNIHSLQSPVFADNPPFGVPPSEMYAVFGASISLAPAQP